jgi:hypothetical protein
MNGPQRCVFSQGVTSGVSFRIAVPARAIVGVGGGVYLLQISAPAHRDCGSARLSHFCILEAT